jgi:cytochrome P450
MPNPVQEGNLIFTDPPRHRQLRKLINTGFTRRQVAILEPKVREIVYGILHDVRSGSTHEFAEELAAPLPTRMIAELLGAPPDDWEQFRRWSDACTGKRRPRDRNGFTGGRRRTVRLLSAADRRPAGPNRETTCCRS